MAKKPRKKQVAAAPVPPMQVDPADWPANVRETWPIGRLLPYANNARTHSVEQIGQITAAIAKWGWTSPVLVDEAGTILAGHGRVMAAKRLGLAEVPVMIARGWSDAAKRAYVLADNKIAENAGWDKEMLALELNAMAQLPDVDFGGMGFSQADLDRLLDPTIREGATDSDAIPPAGREGAAAKSGDVWLLGGHRLVCGDCTNPDHVAAALNGKRPHLMVTDPPYGVNYDPGWRQDAAAKGLIDFAPSALGKVSNDDRLDWRAAWELFQGG